MLYRESWLKIYHKFSQALLVEVSVPISGHQYQPLCQQCRDDALSVVTALGKNLTRLRDIQTPHVVLTPILKHENMLCLPCKRRWIERCDFLTASVRAVPEFSKTPLPK